MELIIRCLVDSIMVVACFSYLLFPIFMIAYAMLGFWNHKTTMLNALYTEIGLLVIHYALLDKVMLIVRG